MGVTGPVLKVSFDDRNPFLVHLSVIAQALGCDVLAASIDTHSLKAVALRLSDVTIQLLPEHATKLSRKTFLQRSWQPRIYQHIHLHPHHHCS